MLDTFTGLPTHVLVVHATVVIVPVAAIVTFAVAVAALPALAHRRPGRAARFAWWVVGLDAAVVLLAWLTRESGEELLRRVSPDPAARPGNLADHVALGGDLLWYTLGLLGAAVLVALVGHPRTRGRIAPGGLPRAVGVVVAVLALAAAVLTTVQVVRAGHSGSSVVWDSIVQNT